MNNDDFKNNIIHLNIFEFLIIKDGLIFDLFGLKTIKNDVANYIENRDDLMISYWKNIYLVNSSNDAIQVNILFKIMI